MPKLRELDAHFLRYREETKEEMFARGAAKPTFFLEHVHTLSEAHGIRFVCPKSFSTHGGVVGAHSVQVYFAGSPVPPHIGVNAKNECVRRREGRGVTLSRGAQKGVAN